MMTFLIPAYRLDFEMGNTAITAGSRTNPVSGSVGLFI